MNELLKELKERLVQIAIVGLKSAPEDFRLKKIQEKLKVLSTKAPVLGKLYELVTKLVEGEDLITTFATLTNLVNAIIYTQGKSEISGGKELLEVFEQKKQLPRLSHLQLKEVREILYGKKTSKWHQLKKAYDAGVLFDYRLLEDFLNNLGDTYEYDDYEYIDNEPVYFSIRTILLQYQEPIVPILLKRFDSATPGEKRNIVKLVSELGKEKYNDYYKTWIENEEDDKVVIESLKALAYEEDNRNYLLEYKARKKKMQEARVYALAHFDGKEERAEVINQCFKNDDIFRMVMDNKLLSDDEILELAWEQAQLLNKTKKLDKSIDDNKNYLSLCALLWNMNRDNEKAKSLLLQIMKMDTGDSKLCFESKFGIRDVSLTIFNRYQSQEMLDYLASLKDSYQGYYITISFIAALYCYDRKKVFDEFSDLAYNNYKKVNVNIIAVLEQLASSVTDIQYSEACESSSFKKPSEVVRIDLGNYEELWIDLEHINWDSRWIRFAKQHNRISLFIFFALQCDLDASAKQELKAECMHSLETLKRDSGKDICYPNLAGDKRKEAEITIKSIVMGLLLAGESDVVIEHIPYFMFYLGALEQIIFTFLEEKDLPHLEQVRAQIQDIEAFGNKKVNTFLEKTIHIVEAKNNQNGTETACPNK